MPKPCSLDLRERVLDAVETGASRREAADLFDTLISPRLPQWRRIPARGRATDASGYSAIGLAEYIVRDEVIE
jgi:transposase